MAALPNFDEIAKLEDVAKQRAAIEQYFKEQREELDKALLARTADQAKADAAFRAAQERVLAALAILHPAPGKEPPKADALTAAQRALAETLKTVDVSTPGALDRLITGGTITAAALPADAAHAARMEVANKYWAARAAAGHPYTPPDGYVDQKTFTAQQITDLKFNGVLSDLQAPPNLASMELLLKAGVRVFDIETGDMRKQGEPGATGAQLQHMDPDAIKLAILNGATILRQVEGNGMEEFREQVGALEGGKAPAYASSQTTLALGDGLSGITIDNALPRGMTDPGQIRAHLKSMLVASLEAAKAFEANPTEQARYRAIHGRDFSVARDFGIGLKNHLAEYADILRDSPELRPYIKNVSGEDGLTTVSKDAFTPSSAAVVEGGRRIDEILGGRVPVTIYGNAVNQVTGEPGGSADGLALLQKVAPNLSGRLFAGQDKYEPEGSQAVVGRDHASKAAFIPLTGAAPVAPSGLPTSGMVLKTEGGAVAAPTAGVALPVATPTPPVPPLAPK